jgi:hypothetical protein
MYPGGDRGVSTDDAADEGLSEDDVSEDHAAAGQGRAATLRMPAEADLALGGHERPGGYRRAGSGWAGVDVADLGDG